MYYPNHNAIDLFADGSARPTNPGPGGIGIAIEYPDHLDRPMERIRFGYIKSTNNRMELSACIEALTQIRSRNLSALARPVRLYSDSTYVCENVVRAAGWQANQWRNQNDRPVHNADLWRELMRMIRIVGVTPEWAPRRSTPGLEAADDLAKVGSGLALPDRTDRGLREGNASRSMVNRGPIEIYEAIGGEAIIYVYWHRYIHGEIEVRFNVFNEDDDSFEGRYIAFCSPETRRELHRNHYYKAQFGGVQGHPSFTAEDWVKE